MNKNWEKELWEGLEKHFRTITEEIMLEKDSRDAYTLHCLFTTVKGGGGISLFDAQIYTAGEDLSYFEIMVMPQFSIADGKRKELEEVIKNMNYFMPLGALGIYYPRNELFFRYIMPLDTAKEVGKTVREIGRLYETIGVIFGNLYEALESVATGGSTYGQEVEEGRLLRQ